MPKKKTIDKRIANLSWLPTRAILAEIRGIDKTTNHRYVVALARAIAARTETALDLLDITNTHSEGNDEVDKRKAK